MIDQNQDLEVRLPNLGASDVIIPASLKLYFTLVLSSSYTARYFVNKICKAIIQNLKIVFKSNVVQDLQDYNVISVYIDEYLTKKERVRRIEQGIKDDDVINKIHIGAKTAAASDEQKAVAAAYGNRFCIPLGEHLIHTYIFPM